MWRGGKGWNHPEGRRLDADRGEVGESSSVVKINKYDVDSGGPDVLLRNVLLKQSQKVGKCPCGNQQQGQQL